MDYFNNNWGWYDNPIDTGYRTYAPATKEELKRLQFVVTGNFNKLVDEFNSNVDQLTDVKSAADIAVTNASNVINSANSAITIFNSDYATPSSIASVANNANSNASNALNNANSAISYVSYASNAIEAYNLVLSGYGSKISSNIDANNSLVNNGVNLANSASINASAASSGVNANTSIVNSLASEYSNASNAVNSFNNSADVFSSVANSYYSAVSDFNNSNFQFKYEQIMQTSSYVNSVYLNFHDTPPNVFSAANIVTDFNGSYYTNGAIAARSNFIDAVNNSSSLATQLNNLQSQYSNANNVLNSAINVSSSFNDVVNLGISAFDIRSSAAENVLASMHNEYLEFSWSASANQSYVANFASYATQISNDAVSISGFASAANDAYNNAQANNSLASQANSNANQALELAQSAQANAGGANSTAFDARTIAEKASSDASLASSAELVDSSNIAVNSASIAYNDLNRQSLVDIWNKPSSYAYSINLPGVQSTVQIQRASGGRYNLIINPGQNETMETNGLVSYSGTSGDSATTAGSVVNKPTQLSTSVGYSYVTTIDLYILVHIGQTDKAYHVNGITPGNQTYSSFSNQPKENAYVTVQRMN